MKAFFVCIAALILIQGSAAFGEDQPHLIPREKFFSSEEMHGFYASDDALHIYYRNTLRPNDLYRVDPISAQRDTFSFPEPIRWFTLLNNQPLVAWGEQQIQLSLSGTPIPLPEGLVSCRLNRISGNMAALEITARNPEFSGIYILNAEGLTLTKKFDPQGFNNVFLDANMELVAARRNNNPAGGSIFSFNKNETQWDEIHTQTNLTDRFLEGFSSIVSVTDDGQGIYFTSNATTDKSRFYLFNRQTGEIKELASNEKADILSMGALINQDGSVSSVVSVYAESQHFFLDDSAREDYLLLKDQLWGDISFAQSVKNNTVWLVREMLGGLRKAYLFDRSTKTLTFISEDFPALKDQPLARRYAFEVTSHDGLKLPVHVYLPVEHDKEKNGIPQKPLPTILYVHGGPWAGVSHWNSNFHCRNFQLLANRGYAVINVEFRGSTGLGKTFTDLGNKKWGTAMTQDKVAIAGWAIQMGIADDQKTGIWGWSYGGYAAFAALAFAPEIFTAGISMYGISDLEEFCRGDFGSSPLWKRRVGDADLYKDSIMLVEHSPYHNIQTLRAPMYLSTGLLDDRIPEHQMGKMAQALKNQGNQIIYTVYPEEGHDYMDTENWISFWAMGEKFLASTLGGKLQDTGQDPGGENYKVIINNIF